MKDWMNIYFLRHGQTAAAGTYTGSTDVPLSAEGISQILNISSYLREIIIDFAYCSTLVRCRKSFELLQLPIECSFDAALTEINFGTWETRSFNQIYRDDKQNMEEWFRLREAFTFPEGDNIRQFSSRIKDWFENLGDGRYKNVLVVSHAGVIKHAITHLLGLDINQADQFEVVEGRVSLVSIDDGFAVLKYLNKNC